MQTAICTLFEDHYHYGVAALVNSLYRQGYRGNIYAGYRGTLPFWATFPESKTSIDWKDSKSFDVADGLQLHFLQLNTDYHFTNYKPDFMLLVWNTIAKEAEQFYYFDPDIVVTSPWNFFEEWVNCGVALCEDVNSPLAEYHPRRVAWRRYFLNKGIKLCYKNSIYVNGGFIGVEDKGFLVAWKNVQELMALQIGGLNRSSLKGSPLHKSDQGPFAPFSKTDQDALNATIEAWDGKVSFANKAGMAFEGGTTLVPHALGNPKPWYSKPMIQALYGHPPRLVDRVYWNSANGVVISQPYYLIRLRKFSIVCAAFIGRFYRKGAI